MATGASADADASTATVNNDNNNSISADTVCPICTQPFTEPRLQLPGCAHTFCGACLASWLETSLPQATCPMCRRVIEDSGGLFARAGMRRPDRNKLLPRDADVPGSEWTQLILLASVPADGNASTSSSSSTSSTTQVIKPAAEDTQEADVDTSLPPVASSQGVTAFVTALAGAWRLHSRYGESITVSHRGQTASWAATGKGIIVTSQPMAAGVRYEIQLDQSVGAHGGRSLPGGEVPVGGDSLPGDTAAQSVTDGWECDLVFHHDVYERGRAGPVTALGRKLIHLPRTSRFGATINHARELCLYRDGKEITSCHLSSSPSPYAAVFELRIKYT